MSAAKASSSCESCLLVRNCRTFSPSSRTKSMGRHDRSGLRRSVPQTCHPICTRDDRHRIEPITAPLEPATGPTRSSGLLALSCSGCVGASDAYSSSIFHACGGSRRRGGACDTFCPNPVTFRAISWEHPKHLSPTFGALSSLPEGTRLACARAKSRRRPGELSSTDARGRTRCGTSSPRTRGQRHRRRRVRGCHEDFLVARAKLCRGPLRLGVPLAPPALGLIFFGNPPM